MMKMLLKKFGVEADTADSGRAAVDIISLSVDPYQLVLMDNLMPEMVRIINLHLQCSQFELVESTFRSVVWI
jgi:CheY-like chemotaxis protein